MSNCQYPVLRSTLAAAARPKRCGKPGGVLCLVPYADSMTGVPHMKAQELCVAHASEVAAWKLIQSLPKKNFTREELEWMAAEGVEQLEDLTPETDVEVPLELLDA